MKHTIIIAEAGVNHNGDISVAKKLIDVAAIAGVDYVKFQSFCTEKLVSKHVKKAEYQIRNTSNSDDSQYEMLKRLELNESAHFELISYCKEKKVAFFSTAFDIESLQLLKKFNLGLWKIPSGEITNYPYLRWIAKQNESVILSTGMSDFQDIQNAIDVLKKFGLDKSMITVLHCNTEYPTPMRDVNLEAMLGIKERFDVQVGYSDHTEGIEIPIAAVALGATIIEKHFTLNKNMEGPDHKASLEPDELKKMVVAIRNVELAMGDKIKKVSLSELKNKNIARKSIVASRQIKKGEKFSEENLTVMRPGDGISPMRWNDIIGQTAYRDFCENELIDLREC